MTEKQLLSVSSVGKAQKFQFKIKTQTLIEY